MSRRCTACGADRDAWLKYLQENGGSCSKAQEPCSLYKNRTGWVRGGMGNTSKPPLKAKKRPGRHEGDAFFEKGHNCAQFKNVNDDLFDGCWRQGLQHFEYLRHPCHPLQGATAMCRAPASQLGCTANNKPQKSGAYTRGQGQRPRSAYTSVNIGRVIWQLTAGPEHGLLGDLLPASICAWI